MVSSFRVLAVLIFRSFKFYRACVLGLAIAVLAVSVAGAQQSGVAQWNATQWWRSGATLDLDFQNQKYKVDNGNSDIASTATPFYLGGGQSFVSRASSGTYYDSSGYIQSASTNVARTSYNPDTLVSLGTLIEPSRTNLITQATGTTGVTLVGSPASTYTTTAVTGPDNSTTMMKCAEGATSGGGMTCRWLYSFAASTTYTASMYVKAAEKPAIVMLVSDNGSTAGSINVDLTNGVVAVCNTSYSVAGTIQKLPNSIYRVALTFTTSASPTAAAYFDIRMSNQYPSTGCVGDAHTTDGGGVYVWGVQLEVGGQASSFINTTSGAVTRSADVYRSTPSGGDYTSLSSLVTDLGATFTRASTTTVTYTGAPFYISGSDALAFSSRGSTGTYYNSSGTLTTAATNQARVDYDPVTHALNGTLIEPSSTNSLRNSSMSGAVVSATVTPVAISSITHVTTTATVTTASAHGLVAGGVVTISGASPSGYNGTYTVMAAPTTTTFTYVVGADPGVDATTAGSYTAITKGALPTYWTEAGQMANRGLNFSVIDKGTINGMPYFDFRIFGVPHTTCTWALAPEVKNIIGGTAGQTWTQSVYVAMLSGTIPSGITFKTHDQYMDADGVTTLSTASFAAFTPTSTLTRYSTTGTISNGSGTATYQYPEVFYMAVAAGALGSSVDMTFRIALPQLEQKPYVTSPIPTTSATVTRSADLFTTPLGATYFDSSGVMRTAAANTPRLDYDPVTLAPKGLLIETTRTNLLPYSWDFITGYSNPSSLSLTANAATSPDGNTAATKMTTVSSSSITQYIYKSFTGAASTNYTFSVFAKNVTGGTYHRLNLGLGNTGFGAGAGIYYGIVAELNDCSINNSSAGINATIAYSAQNIGNGWCRFSVTGVTLASPGVNFVGAINIVNASNQTVFTGDGTGIYIWGAQVEAGTYPTSYIPTYGATLARAADVLNIPTGAWYSADKGTLITRSMLPYLDTTATRRVVMLNTGAGIQADSIIHTCTQGLCKMVVIVGSVLGYSQSNGSCPTAAGAYFNMVTAFDSSGPNVRAALCGTLFSLSTTQAIPSMTMLAIGSQGTNGQLDGYLARVTYMQSREPDNTLTMYAP